MRPPRPLPHVHRLRWLLAIGLLGACYSGSGGTPGEASDTGGPDSGDDDAGSSSSGGEGPADEGCEDVVGVPSSIRALNRREYANTIRDLLALDAATVATTVQAFPPDAIVGFDNRADALVASDLLVEQHFDAAESLADSIDIGALLDCAPAQSEDECAASWLATFGRRAFRRPLLADESASLLGVYQDARGAGRDFDTAARMLLHAILISPQLLYRAEHGVADEAGTAEVDAYELASRLSYFLWASMPDDALLQAADDGVLATTDAIEAQARRLLDDPRARETVTEFHRQWLELYRIPQVERDETLAPGFADIKPALVEETLRFVEHVIWSGGGLADTLLVSDTIVVNDALAAYYGLPGDHTAVFAEVPATAERFGLLTQAGILAQAPNQDRTSPTRRGNFVRDQLLCQAPPPPPADIPALPEVDADASMRERMAQHAADPACVGCHQLIDPIGFGLEEYDLGGRYRTQENGVSVDASGEVTGVSVEPGTFVGARALSELLVQTDEYEACVTTQVFEFAMGRSVADEDACAMDSLQSAMQASGGDIPELLVSIATSKAFRQRVMEVAP
jgi:hypothetical protein